MEAINTLCSVIVGIIVLIGIPASIIWLIVATVKKQSKAMPKKLLIGCVAGLIVFTVIGSMVWQETDDYDEYLVEMEEQERQEALANAQKEQEETNKVEKEDGEPQTVTSQQETEPQTEPIEQETQLNVDDLTEEEYKAMCEVIYNADISEENVQVGQYVKFQAFLTKKGQYSYGDMFATIINKLMLEYDLEEEYVVGGVLHRLDSDQHTRYVGEEVYLLFNKEYTLSADDFEEAEYAVVYGEVVQTWSGFFVIPKYIEVVDGLVDNLSEGTY